MVSGTLQNSEMMDRLEWGREGEAKSSWGLGLVPVLPSHEVSGGSKEAAAKLFVESKEL